MYGRRAEEPHDFRNLIFLHGPISDLYELYNHRGESLPGMNPGTVFFPELGPLSQEEHAVGSFLGLCTGTGVTGSPSVES